MLPAGTGKTVRVAVFASGEKAEQAKAAGADVVGMEDLAAQIKGGDIPFDVVIASPDTMRIAGDLMEKGVDFSNIIDESFLRILPLYWKTFVSKSF